MKMLNMKTNVGDTYSKIIRPVEYNQIVSNEHLYIASADKFMLKKIKGYAYLGAEVVELGCGPARILPLIREIEGISLSGVDTDNEFLVYAQEIMKNSNTRIICGDVETYQHDKKVDIFYSHGLHHHIAKGPKTQNYLKNIYNNLRNGGYYILVDEFIPDYETPQERELKIVIWYSHVIAHAIKHNHSYLAQEESKILLDDLYEGRSHINFKNQEQIELILSYVGPIDQAACNNNLIKAEELSKEFLSALENRHSLIKHGDPTLDLSRGDFKICDKVFKQEAKMAGFDIIDVKAFGPAETIGSVSIYTLRKE